MTEETSALAPEAGPEAIVETPEVALTEGQVTDQTAEGEEPEEKVSKAKERRERERAAKARLFQERDDALAAAEAAKGRVAKIKAAIEAEKEPTEAEFPDAFDLTAAKGGWHMARRLLNREASDAEADETAASQRLAAIEARRKIEIDQNWSTRAVEAEGRYADFQAIVAAPGLFPKGSAIVDLIKESDVAGDLAYAIARDRSLHDDLLRMQPVEAARAIGRIEASLQTPKPRTETNAPPPINPVRGSGSATVNPDKLSMEDYIAARRSGKIR